MFYQSDIGPLACLLASQVRPFCLYPIFLKKINTENERKMPAAEPPIGMSLNVAIYGEAENRSVVNRKKNKIGHH